MSKSVPIPILLEPFIKRLGFDKCILSSDVTYDSDTDCTLIKTCDTGHLDNCYLKDNSCCNKAIKINDVDYQVKDFVYCESITVYGQLPTPIIDECNRSLFKIEIEAPFYLHGTPLSVDNEMVQIKLGCEKYPLVYLYEPIVETFDKKYDSCIERVVSIRLFFMNLTDPKHNKNTDFTTELLPMRNLAERFVDLICKDKCHFSGVERYKITSHSNFGKLNEQGYYKNYFTDFVSAIQLDIEFSINKSICNKKCYCIKC